MKRVARNSTYSLLGVNNALPSLKRTASFTARHAERQGQSCARITKTSGLRTPTYATTALTSESKVGNVAEDV